MSLWATFYPFTHLTNYPSTNFMACYFCQRNAQEIDFKDTDLLSRFLSGLAKIKPRKRTGVCSKHQRKLSKAIKKARHLGLLPYTIR